MEKLYLSPPRTIFCLYSVPLQRHNFPPHAPYAWSVALVVALWDLALVVALWDLVPVVVLLYARVVVPLHV